MSGRSLRKSACALLLCSLFSSACFSERYYQISGAELDEIQSRTEILTSSVERLTESVRTLEEQRNQYMALSDELRNEAESMKSKVRAYRLATLCIGAGLLGAAAFCALR